MSLLFIVGDKAFAVLTNQVIEFELLLIMTSGMRCESETSDVRFVYINSNDSKVNSAWETVKSCLHFKRSRKFIVSCSNFTRERFKRYFMI